MKSSAVEEKKTKNSKRKIIMGVFLVAVLVGSPLPSKPSNLGGDT